MLPLASLETYSKLFNLSETYNGVISASMSQAGMKIKGVKICTVLKRVSGTLYVSNKPWLMKSYYNSMRSVL